MTVGAVETVSVGVEVGNAIVVLVAVGRDGFRIVTLGLGETVDAGSPWLPPPPPQPPVISATTNATTSSERTTFTSISTAIQSEMPSGIQPDFVESRRRFGSDRPLTGSAKLSGNSLDARGLRETTMRRYRASA